MGGRYGNVVTGPKKTPANTVKNSTFSTSNRFSGPQSGRTAVSTGGFGQGVGQVSRPALAAAAVAQGPQSGRTAVSTGGFGQGVGAAPAPSDDAVQAWLNSAGAQNLFAQNAQVSQPSGPPSGRTAVSTGGFGQGVGQIQRPSVPAGPPSGRTIVCCHRPNPAGDHCG